MRKVFIVLTILIIATAAMATQVMSAPYLVCDIPPADQQVLGVRGSVDGTTFDTPYKIQNGSLLVYDIGPLSPAKHAFTNIRFYNIRGESTPVPFDLPAAPSPPSNISLKP